MLVNSMEMQDVKQVIVVRTDLNMRKGKLAAQVAHASLKSLWDLRCVADCSGEDSKVMAKIELSPNFYNWLEGIYTKIVLGIDSKEALLELADKSQKTGIQTTLIEDLGLTEFKGEKTLTCAALGPDIATKIDSLTKHLKLL